jgi:hypothetical protein
MTAFEPQRVVRRISQIIQERIEIEEAAFAGVKGDLVKTSS